MGMCGLSTVQHFCRYWPSILGTNKWDANNIWCILFVRILKALKSLALFLSSYLPLITKLCIENVWQQTLSIGLNGTIIPFNITPTWNKLNVWVIRETELEFLSVRVMSGSYSNRIHSKVKCILWTILNYRKMSIELLSIDGYCETVGTTSCNIVLR